MKKWLLTLAVMVCVPAFASATEVANVQNYAHPTFFGSQSQATFEQAAKSLYIVGEKNLLPEDQLTVKNKNQVVVDNWVKDVLSVISNNCRYAFNPNLPTLRSEVAVIISEGLEIPANAKTKYNYLDIANGYWAKSWIDKALAEDIMIGYPDRKFRPDQPITKAEVFATVAQLINVKTDASKVLPTYNGNKMQYIPNWAISATKEVMASTLLNNVPEPEKVASEKYLTSKQVAYIIGELRASYLANNYKYGKKYTFTTLKVKLTERVDVRHSNIGDTFIAKTLSDATVDGKVFKAGSSVKGQVVAVSRPGLKNPGYIKVKFIEIKNGDVKAEFSKTITDTSATKCKNTNVIARFVGAPFSAAGRVAGVAGRTAAAGANVVSNGTERLGDNVSNAFVNTLSLQPMAGLRSVGKGFVTIGMGIYDVAKLAVSGTFGVVYEFADEVVYLVLPSASSQASLNAGEELTIVY